MANVCFSSVQGLAARVTRLDSVGKWSTGATASAITSGFIKIEPSDNTEAGTEYKAKNAAGENCVNRRGPKRLNWIDLKIDFCKVDPEFYEIVAGNRIVEDHLGDSVGFAKGQPSDGSFALEVWSMIDGDVSKGEYIYWLYPRVENGWLTHGAFEDGVMTFMLEANTAVNPYWAKGPYNVVAQDAGGTPGKLLDGVGATEHEYSTVTKIAPPTAQCGYVAQLVAWA